MASLQLADCRFRIADFGLKKPFSMTLPSEEGFQLLVGSLPALKIILPFKWATPPGRFHVFQSEIRNRQSAIK
jgi:hypothetical protein